MTTFERAVREGDIKEIERFLKNGFDITALLSDGKPVLTLPRESYILRYLIKKGADVNQYITTSYGTKSDSVLEYHAYNLGRYSNNNMIRILVESGANITETCIDEAISTGNYYLLTLYFKYNPSIFNNIMPYGAIGRYEILDFFFQHTSFDVNKTNNNGDTILHVALRNYSPIDKDTLDLLFEKGFDFCKQNNAGNSFYSLAPDHIKKIIDKYNLINLGTFLQCASKKNTRFPANIIDVLATSVSGSRRAFNGPSFYSHMEK